MNFTRFKYPRTLHLPWSEGISNEDKVMNSRECHEAFHDQIVLVTEKLDGEYTTIYSDGFCHARSIDCKAHESRSYVKNLAASKKHLMHPSLRIVGENVFAKHSIKYDKLEDYFYGFMVISNSGIVESANNTVSYFEKLGIKHVPVLYYGTYNESIIKNLFTGKSYVGNESEGYVIRNANSFHIDDFQKNVAKFVRKNHVQTDEHWMNNPIEKNGVVLNE